MNKLLFGLAFLPTFGYAQLVTVPKMVQCGDAKAIMELLMTEFKEKPVILMDTDTEKSKIAVFSNQETKTWTMIEFNTEIACVLSTGKNFSQSKLNVKNRGNSKLTM